MAVDPVCGMEVDPQTAEYRSEYKGKSYYFCSFDVFRKQALPIGSGTVENAANTVAHHRLKRPGRGWERENGQAMLAGLSELHSGRFDQAWRLTFSRS